MEDGGCSSGCTCRRGENLRRKGKDGERKDWTGSVRSYRFMKETGLVDWGIVMPRKVNR